MKSLERYTKNQSSTKKNYKIQSIFKQIIKPSSEFKKIFDLYCMENSMQRSNALWEAVISFILLFENESIEAIKNKLKNQKKNLNNKKLIFAELMKNHPRWRGYDKYSERMMKFSKTYPNRLKHEISVTLSYFIHGIQSSCIGKRFTHTFQSSYQFLAKFNSYFRRQGILPNHRYNRFCSRQH